MKNKSFSHSFVIQGKIFLYLFYRSLEVDAKAHTCAEKGLILEGKCCIVVVLNVPETFWGNADTLAFDFTNNTLDNDFVTWNAKHLDLVLYLVYNVFCPILGLVVIILFVFKTAAYNFLDNILGFWRIKSKMAN